MHVCAIKGTVSKYKRIVNKESRMRILVFQSSTWVMWFCEVAITQFAHAMLGYTLGRVCTLALASEIDIVRMQKDWSTSFFDV